MRTFNISLLSTALTIGLFGLSAFAGDKAMAKMEPSKAEPNIVAVASGNPDFSTLVTALKAAGLVETLSGKGPFTVFAPNNAAFAKLPAGTLDNLLKPENKSKLVSILTYHVAPVKAMASDVVKLKSAPTVNGKSVTITAKDGKVMLDKATVIATDIPASNGVIHVIDTVLMP